MSESSADVVICGAGIAGIAAAYHHARWFTLKRYADPEYRQLLARWGNSAQL